MFAIFGLGPLELLVLGVITGLVVFFVVLPRSKRAANPNEVTLLRVEVERLRDEVDNLREELDRSKALPGAESTGIREA